VSGAEAEVATAAEPFIAELKHWRDVSGLSRKALATKLGYDASYVTKIESGASRPTEAFARRGDDVLRTGGALLRRWHEYVERTPRPERGSTALGGPGSTDATASDLVVEHDEAVLHYDGETYTATMRRRIRNVAAEPVTRYLVRISVDRHPGDPERSNELYRRLPLRWDDLALEARAAGEPMRWEAKHDRDAFKEVWLLFENEHGRFPLYPGQATWIEYRYRVSDEQWGNWFQRAVRLPTEHLRVQLDFPADLDPAVWGTETSMTAEAKPLPTAIQQRTEGGRQLHDWATESPALHTRFRLEWRFRALEESAAGEEERVSESEKMRRLGIVQEGDPVLRERARPFQLPEEAEDARRIVAELQSAMERVAQVHVFGKGMGLAAPQLGISRAAAVIRPPHLEPITLLNPVVVEESGDDEQYEGCLSFFDVRGLVPRPLVLHVEHQDIDGQRRITIFRRGDARLVAHEIDHLDGRLYTDRMRPGVSPIPVSEYRGTGTSWSYRSGGHTSRKAYDQNRKDAP